MAGETCAHFGSHSIMPRFGVRSISGSRGHAAGQPACDDR